MSAFRGSGMGSTNGAAPGSMRAAFGGGGGKPKPPPLMDPTRERDRSRILRCSRPTGCG